MTRTTPHLTGNDLTRRALMRLVGGVALAGAPTLAPVRHASARIGRLPVPVVTATSVYVVEDPASLDDGVSPGRGDVTIVPWMEANADERLQPASTTKIVTAQLAVDHADLDETVVVDVADLADGGESAMYLDAGETLTVQQLLQGALISSGNDAARSLARHVGSKILDGESGDPIERFVELMNNYVTQLGLVDTRFTNAEGLDDPGQHSTARDLGTIATRFMRNETLAGIVGQLQVVVTSVGDEARTYLDPVTGESLLNRNQMLEGNLYGMEGVHGVKTGTTPLAGANLIAAWWSPGGTRVIAVVLGSEIEFEGDYQVSGSDRRYDDMRMILDEIDASYA